MIRLKHSILIFTQDDKDRGAVFAVHAWKYGL